ncbi:MAG: SlyX family protein [Sphingomonadales bacterium]|mgnify:CR=1 FL=1
MTDKGLLKRLEDLEVKFAFQTETFEDLNQTALKQWVEIDTLKVQISYLKNQITEFRENDSKRPENKTPPHY